MSATTPDQRTLVFGILIAGLGLLCLGGGIALLAWRVADPEQAVLLPPGVITPTIATATPGVLGTPLPPPPLPDDLSQIVMLPVSDLPTATATSIMTITPTPSMTTTREEHDEHAPTITPVTPTAAPTYTPVPTTTSSPTLTLTPTSTPSPTLTPAQPAIAPKRILIDRIALDAPVVRVGQHTLTVDGQVFSQWDVPEQRAAGWQHNGAVLDQPGNVVLNGHHNVHGEVFRYINVLEPGDWLALEAGSQRYYYVVVQTLTLAEQDQPVEVRQENARWILPTADERVTLITCWPYYANTHRVVVIARPIDAVIPPADIP